MKSVLKEKMLKSMAASMMFSPIVLTNVDDGFEGEIKERIETISINKLEVPDGKGKQGFIYTTKDKSQKIKKEFISEENVNVFLSDGKMEMKIIKESFIPNNSDEKTFFGTETRYEFFVDEKYFEKQSRETLMDEES